MPSVSVPKLNLVLVDDAPTIVRIATRMLANSVKDQFEIVPFTDAHEAQFWIEHNCCDLLLADIEMPDLDGLEILRLAKQRNAWTQVILMTAQSNWDRITEAMESGASNYLLKPLKREEIVTVVQQEYTRCARWQNAARGTLAKQQTQLA